MYIYIYIYIYIYKYINTCYQEGSEVTPFKSVPPPI